jgi:DeoR family transcriptional regulator, suf operon transcriptional repressor
MSVAPQKPKTRARVIELLRQGHHTVDELAQALQLTDNAVRMHLSALERAGVVRSDGVRRSGAAGKPATIYHIAPEAESSFSHAYAPLLASLVATLGQRFSPAELETVLRSAGKRLGEAQPRPTGNLQKRVREASDVLNQLGALFTVEGENGTAVVRGGSCPLSVAVRQRTETCHAVEELLTVLVGANVQRRCQLGDKPTCCFEVTETG